MGQGGTTLDGATWSPAGSMVVYTRSTWESRTDSDGTTHDEFISSSLVVVDARGADPRERRRTFVVHDDRVEGQRR